MTIPRRRTISPHPLEIFLRGGALALAGLAVASCASVQRTQQPAAQQAAPPAPAAPAAGDSSSEAEIGVLPQDGVVVQTAAQTAVDQVQRAGRQLQIGTFSERAPRVQIEGDDTIALNLEQEDLRRVFEQLGNALNLNMIIDPAINAVVSVRTTENNPLTYDDIWPLMRMLARSAGVAIEQSGDVWRFFLSQERIPAQIVMPNFLGNATASEVLQVTPLRYITRETAAQILAPLLQDDGSIIALGARNVIGISGSPGLLTRVNALLQVIDDDPFQNQGIKLYTLRNTQAADVAAELTGILALIQGQNGVYQALGLPRVNAVLVVGSPGRGFDEVDRWVAVLDAESQEQVEQLFVYSVKNLTATTLAQTLQNVFGEIDDTLAQTAAPQQGLGPLFNQGPGVAAQQVPGVAFQVPGGAAQPGQVVIQQVAPAGAAAGGAAGGAAGAAGGAGGAGGAGAAGAAGVSANLAVSIVADEDTNSLLIRATPRDYRQLLTVIRRLDAAPRQVMINAVIGQATLTEGHAYGVDWVRVSENLENGPARLSTNFLPTGLFGEDGLPTPGSGLILTRTFANASSVIDATLQAIAADTEVTLLARPTIMATNNQQGEIVVGQSVPVESGSTVSGNGTVVANIAYRDVGIVLTVTPRINEDGLINLEIFQSLSSVEDVAGGVNDNPIFTNQEITTTAVVADGSLIALGGLIQEEEMNGNSGVPGLRRIPFIKALFSYTEQSKTRRELFVILRPQIVGSDEAGRAAQQAFRDSFEVLKEKLDDFWY